MHLQPMRILGLHSGQPSQTPNPAQVESPLELETICGKELAQILSKPAGQVSKVRACWLCCSARLRFNSFQRPLPLQTTVKRPRKESSSDERGAGTSTNKRKGAKPERAHV